MELILLDNTKMHLLNYLSKCGVVYPVGFLIKQGYHNSIITLIQLRNFSVLYYILSYFQLQDQSEAPPPLADPVTSKTKELVNEVHIRCNCSWSRESRELAVILSKPIFKALIDAHDEIAAYVENPKPTQQQEYSPKLFPNGMTADAIRMVGVRKKHGEPLGLTVSIIFTTYKQN